MNERKIRIRQLPDGRWAASASGWLDFYVMVVRDEGYEAAEDAGRAASLAEPVVTATTPWDASSTLCEVLGEDVPVEWETLPWPTLREAHGIVGGVCELLGAGRDVRRAIDAAVYAEEMRELGVSRYMALEPEDRAGLAASAAEFLLGFRSQPDRRNAERALRWARVAASGLPGYGAALRLIPAALAAGYPERRRAQRLMDRARCALVKANMANDIAPDSR